MYYNLNNCIVCDNNMYAVCFQVWLLLVGSPSWVVDYSLAAQPRP